MIKISKIRVFCVVLAVVIVMLSSSCTSCINKYEEMPNGVTLNVSDTITEYLVQKDLPSLHFNYKGVRVMMEAHGSACFFVSNNQEELRYNDTRKFGKMHLVRKNELELTPIAKLGLEPWDESLTKEYLKEKLNKKKAIKTLLLDQTIIVGIGNIYADEILFLSKINPETEGCNLTKKNLQDIIDNTKKVLEKAIQSGGTTIHTYTSVDGITGRFQQQLLVHGKKSEPCPNCQTEILKIVVNGRGTYYCPKCQK